MRKIIVNGREFEYETWWESYGEDSGSDPVTYFYEGTETITQRRWILFGKKIEITQPKCVFKIFGDADDTQLSKEWWRSRIEKKIELLDRADELKRGELC